MLRVVTALSLAFVALLSNTSFAIERPSEIHRAFYCAGMVWPLSQMETPRVKSKYYAIEAAWLRHGSDLLSEAGYDAKNANLLSIEIFREGLNDLDQAWTDFKKVPYYGITCESPPGL